MRILISGANGYIGSRITPVLLKEGHTILCTVRNKGRFDENYLKHEQIETYEIDFSEPNTGDPLPDNIDAAYYFLHSMSEGKDFEEQEKSVAKDFLNRIKKTQCQQIIYLSGISNEENLSPHLQSRKNVENILNSSHIPCTILRAGIILGSGSASFEIMRDIVEKLPFMITPKWLNTISQPIAIADVIQILTRCILHEEFIGKTYDIGGDEILSYKELLLKFSKQRGLKRWIITLPVMTPKLSSYWLYFVTSTSYSLSQHLVESMTIPVVRENNKVNEILNITPLTFNQALARAFDKIAQDEVTSSWKDSFISGYFKNMKHDLPTPPKFGCFKEVQQREIKVPLDDVKNKVWSIGGENGWYYATFLWKIRGYIDKLVGGVGLRRGRRNATKLRGGDALDFWRVLDSNKKGGHLLLFAEMKLPGDGWLEFNFIKKDGKNYLSQEVTFRPKGLLGRLYWYLMIPFHFFIFRGMLKQLSTGKMKNDINSPK